MTDLNRFLVSLYGGASQVILRDLAEVAERFPRLKACREVYVRPNGESVELLKYTGTLPMKHKGVTYHIPVALWMDTGYPRVAPICYVTPVQGMVIADAHNCVDPNGRVRLPYLDQWSGSRSRLLQLLVDMVAAFERVPPVRSPPQHQPQPQPQPQHHQQKRRPGEGHTPVHGGPALYPQPPPSSSGHPGAAYAYPGPPYAQPYSHPPSYPHQAPDARPPPPPYGSGAPSYGYGSGARYPCPSGAASPPSAPQPYYSAPPSPAQEREAALRALGAKVRQRVAEDVTGVLERFMATQTRLEEGSQRIEELVQALKAEQRELENATQVAQGKVDALQQWVTEQDGAVIDPDEVVVATSTVAKQLLETMAEDVMLEEAMYTLNSALLHDTVTLDVYLRQVRILSTQQFKKRALIRKIRNVHQLTV